MWPATLAAKREVDERAAGRLDLGHHESTGSQVDGWNRGLFDFTGYQSDRLMIQGSGRHEQDGIRILFLQDLHEFGHGLLLQCRALVEAAHPERDRRRGEPPDESSIR